MHYSTLKAKLTDQRHLRTVVVVISQVHRAIGPQQVDAKDPEAYLVFLSIQPEDEGFLARFERPEK